MSNYTIGVYLVMSIFASVSLITETNQRYVITGGPGVGKSTLIAQFAKCGYQTIPETYAVLYEQAVKDNTLDYFFADPVALYNNLLAEQLKWEFAVDINAPAFLDRSALDILAFAQYFKVPLTQQFRAQAAREYDLVFFLEPLPSKLYEQCTRRKETAQESLEIHGLIKDAYVQAGYPSDKLIDVPFGRPCERVDYILEAVSEFAKLANATRED